ncbi:pH-response regulator [Trametes sanguinea]|nr:pH-response regulator [Trametes sanguinea]
MPNQLSIPFKKTYIVPIRQAVRDYIQYSYRDTHPDAYRWDINHWEQLRAEATSGAVHINRVNALISYHAQLVYILTKLPADIGLEIPYAPAFDSSALPITLNNLVYERAAILFNLAALYSQLGSAEDRSKPEGLKQAIKFYQSAAGTLAYLHESVLPQLHASIGSNDDIIEFTEPFTKTLEYLMLAQAQECVWQRAVMDNYKNGLIAKLAAKLFSTSRVPAHRSDVPFHRWVEQLFPLTRHPPWIAHLETKHLHFQAAAQYRKSLEDLEAHRYGHEIARLSAAHTFAKQGYDVARRGSVAQAVTQDIKSLLDIVQKNLARAERDNDLIYHQDVPPASSLPAIAEVSMAQPLIDAGLQDVKSVVGKDAVIFGELLGWGARLAIDIYNDRRRNWIAEEIKARIQGLDDSLSRTLESLNLPAALDALDRPVGLPPSLLKKIEEVRLESGPDRIETHIHDVQALGDHVTSLLDEALDVLDQEADEDEVLREHDPLPDRLPSVEANKELVSRAQQFRTVLEQARESDALVRQKWEEWEEAIAQLTWSETDLERSIPSSTISSDSRAVSADPTRLHARALRGLLEQLDDLSRARRELVARVDRLVSTDDITQRISKAASGMEQWVNVQPAMFEDILDEELSKYDKYRLQLEENGERQEQLLRSIKARLCGTSSFYNDFSAILSGFRASCKDFAAARRQEASTLAQQMHHLSIAADSTRAEPQPRAHATSAAPASSDAPDVVKEDNGEHTQHHQPQKQSAGAFALPPPDSDEWETMALPPAPSAPPRATTAKRSSARAVPQGR